LGRIAYVTSQGGIEYV